MFAPFARLTNYLRSIYFHTKEEKKSNFFSILLLNTVCGAKQQYLLPVRLKKKEKSVNSFFFSLQGRIIFKIFLLDAAKNNAIVEKYSAEI